MLTRLIAALFLGIAALHAEPLKFRTDADGPFKPGAKKDPKDPDWFQLVDGEFPPEGSAHAIPGELIQVDHLERQFQIRVDRNDSQDRGVWDLPLDAVMLPYGSIHYRGAPAALQDIPLCTHLRGLFYLKDPKDTTPALPGPFNNRKTPEADFRRCFRLEDDFSFYARQQQLWKIDSVDFATKKLTATLLDKGQPSGGPKIFDLLASTRVMKGEGFANLNALEAGQTVLFNLAWVTLYGPGRVTDIWLDETSRSLATAQQLEKHQDHLKERGFPAWITAVEDEPQIVTLTLFGGVSEKFLSEVLRMDPNTKPEKDSLPALEPRGALAVARPSLMTYDPVNDRKSGSILEVKRIPAEQGSSGIQVRIKMELMLEGYRPKRIVRFYPSSWKVNALPKEEEFFGRE